MLVLFVYASASGFTKVLLINNDLLDWKSMNEDSKRALEYFPDQPLIYILKSVGLLQQKRYDELLTVIDSGVMHAKNDPKILSQLYTYKAEAFYNLKRFDEALTAYDKALIQYQQALKLSPSEEAALRGRSLARAKMQKP